jgi:hypothetical protein
LPYTSSKPRRPPHAHSQSASSPATSDRRGSLPTLHLRSSSSRSIEPPVPALPAYVHENFENANSDYSSLSSFSFGAATSSAPRPDDELENLSPLATLPTHISDRPRRGSAAEDRTPRPSIFYPHDNEHDEEEALRHNRAKMRAIDNGDRRPSLPTNLYSNASDPGQSSSTNPSSTPPEERTALSDVDIEGDAETGGFIDTDVEVDPDPDSISVHTFGIKGKGRKIIAPWETDSDADSDTDAFRRSESSPERRGSISTLPRTPSAPMAPFGVGETETRQREDSVVTLRRASRSVDDELRSLNLNPTGTRPESYAGTTTGSSNDVMEGIDMSYITGGLGTGVIAQGLPGSRRSSLSFVQPLSPPPAKQKKSKNRGKDKTEGLFNRPTN